MPARAENDRLRTCIHVEKEIDECLSRTTLTKI